MAMYGSGSGHGGGGGGGGEESEAERERRMQQLCEDYREGQWGLPPKVTPPQGKDQEQCRLQ